MLQSTFIYSDGLTYQDVQASLQTLKNVKSFYENDLRKQDRQTDKHLIEVEMLLYEVLGVDPIVIKVWRKVH